MPLHELRRFSKFLVVGASSTLLDVLLLSVLVSRVGIAALPANLISYSSGMLWNFALNRRWTYADKQPKALLRQFGQFAAVNLSGLCLNTLIIALLVAAWQSTLGANAYLPAKFAATTVSLLWNYAVNRFWTFRGAPMEKFL